MPFAGRRRSRVALRRARSESLRYDGHGNTTRLADQTLIYDVADRQSETVLDDDTEIIIRWIRVGGWLLVPCPFSAAAEDGTIRYLAGGAIADENGAVKQWVLGFPGGVSAHGDVGMAPQVWGFPNLHGDVIVRADADRYAGGCAVDV